MNINKYTAYFHDGTVHDIKHKKNRIELSIESAELLPEWNEDNILLSNRETLSGNLHLEGVSSIKINEVPFHGVLSVLINTYDDGYIFHIEIHGNKLTLLVSWMRHYQKRYSEETDLFTIQIEAEKIYWENIPDLFDADWGTPFRIFDG